MYYCYSTVYKPPIGLVTVASDGERIVGLWMERQKHYPKAMSGELVKKDDLPIFKLVKRWLDRYLGGDKPLVDELPLAPEGSDFQKKVWKILCEIPYGTYIMYGDIAKRIATEPGKAGMYGRPVGGAVGKNPISIIIPCHRVVGSNGSLTGFGGGMEKKIWLLEHEGVDMTRLYVPTKGTAL